MIEEPEKPGIPEWVVTFGDMMSLLLTFFIMLVSLSEIKQNEKYQALIDSIQRRFGHDSASPSMSPGPQKPRSSKLSPNNSSGRARLQDLVRGGNPVRAPRGEQPLVRDIRHGEVTAIGGMIRFEAADATLTEEHKQTLDRVIAAMKGKPQKVEIRGHAARGPGLDGGPHVDKWQLCYDRCLAAKRYLIEHGVKRHQIRLSQAGEHEPLSTAPDRAKLAENARVEVFLTTQYARELQGSAAERQRRIVDE